MAVPADQVLQVLSLREFHQVLRTCVHKGQSWSHRGICKASGNDNFLVELDSAGGRKGNLRKKKKKGTEQHWEKIYLFSQVFVQFADGAVY